MRLNTPLSTIGINNELFETICKYTYIDTKICGSSENFQDDILLFQNIENNLKNRIIFPRQKTKPDLMLLAFNNNTQENILCFVQCKNIGTKMTTSKFKESIDSLNPWNFFNGTKDLKSQFLDWWSKNLNIFDKYIRV
jgi:hypothetical protein